MTDRPATTPSKRRALLVGAFSIPASLEESYDRAFQTLGWATSRFSMLDAQARHRRFRSLGRLGEVAGRMLGDAPLRQANRDLLLSVAAQHPEVIVVFGPAAVYGGSLAQMMACSSAARVLVWPDTLLNFADTIVTALPLYDLVACYSREACEPLRRLGARAVAWVPLAGDPALHEPTAPRANFRCDVSFIGNWRPEREVSLAKIARERGVELKIWGANWKRYATDPAVLRSFQAAPLFGADFAAAVASSKVNLNLIDPSNLPAANMRFFEVPCAGGAELTSFCDEMASDFVHGEHLYTFSSDDELMSSLRLLLGDDAARERVRACGRARVLAAHTYAHRVAQILAALGHSAVGPAGATG